jgi:hypothetical protein
MSKEIISNGDNFTVSRLDRAYGGASEDVLTINGTTGAIALNKLTTFGNKVAASVNAWVVADPGNAKAVDVTQAGVCLLTSAGAETRTLARPTFIGQRLALIDNVHVGNIVITSSAAINQTGNTVMTFGAAADMIELVGMKVAGLLVWRVCANDGVALS